MNDLILNNGQTAKFLRIDYWSRPVYELECGIEVCCTELNGTYLHTMTSDGEADSPLKNEYQPLKECDSSKINDDTPSKVDGGNLVPSDEALAYAKDELSNVAPIGSGLKVGDVVRWVNDYGVKWAHRIIGFGGNDGNDVHLSTDSHWFPHDVKELTKCSASVLDGVQ